VPSDFTAKITNPYCALTAGALFSYEIRKDDGIERIETYVSEETHIVMGVETRVVWDREWDNGLLIEDTLDYFAQDKDGNVWYFGEDSKAVAAGVDIFRYPRGVLKSNVGIRAIFFLATNITRTLPQAIPGLFLATTT